MADFSPDAKGRIARATREVERGLRGGPTMRARYFGTDDASGDFFWATLDEDLAHDGHATASILTVNISGTTLSSTDSGYDIEVWPPLYMPTGYKFASGATVFCVRCGDGAIVIGGPCPVAE